MLEARTMSEFLHSIPDSPACVRVNIADLPQCVDGVITTLRSKNRDTNQIMKSLSENVRAVCPTCCVWIPPETILGVHLCHTWGKGNVTLTRYGPKAHLLDGRCILDSCASKEIVLIWAGSPVIQSQVANHINRLKAAAEQENARARLACLEQLSEPSVAHFTEDTLWAMWKNADTFHAYLKQTFPCFSTSPDLMLWISVIPYPKETARLVFPEGYDAFLKQILDESKHDTGTISVAHWISMGTTYATSWLNLTLASRLDLPEEERFLIVPNELTGG